MYSIACKDMGMVGCPFVATGSTPEIAMKTLKEHGMRTHAEKMKEMSKTLSEADMMEAMKKVMKSS
jgi:predicted small metal-binding protein